MAARRLLIIMLVLLGISTLAAAMIDTSSFRDEGTSSTVASETTEASLPQDTVPEGRELKPVVIKVFKAPVTVVPVKLGDQLPLIVRSRKPDLVEIPALGLLEPVDSQAPARFDIFADAVGDYGVRLLNAGRVVGRIEVTKRREKNSRAKRKATIEIDESSGEL